MTAPVPTRRTMLRGLAYLPPATAPALIAQAMLADAASPDAALIALESAWLEAGAVTERAMDAWDAADASATPKAYDAMWEAIEHAQAIRAQIVATAAQSLTGILVNVRVAAKCNGEGFTTSVADAMQEHGPTDQTIALSLVRDLIAIGGDS